MILFNNQKKKEQERLNHLNQYGIILDGITPLNNDYSAASPFYTLLKAFLIFCASFGTVAGVVDAFELEYDAFIVIIFLSILSTLIALLYNSRIFFYIGYIILFILFFIGSIAGYFYVNSGFQYFVNAVYSKYSDFFHLNAVRESTIYIQNEEGTVTLAMLFICLFLAILLNITISNKMSVIGTFLITFPIIEIALYIDLKPEFIYLFMLFITYITIGILNRSEHFKLPSIKDSKKEYITYTKSKGKKYYYYLANGFGMGLITVYSVIITVIFLFVSSSIFYSDYDSRTVNNKLKTTVDEAVKTFIQNGFSGFFDRYQNTGGMNHGKLGGVSTVRQDFETDLVVTYVPTSLSRIYLKSFVGNTYISNAFLPDEAQTILHPNAAYNAASKYSLSEYTHPSDQLSRMKIKNIDAGLEEFFPYDSIAYSKNGGTYYSHFAYNPNLIKKSKKTINKYLEDAYYNPQDTTEVVFDSYTSSYFYPDSKYCDDNYEEFIYNNYTEVAPYLKPSLDSVCQEAGLYNINGNPDSQEYRLAILEKLVSFYSSEFTYTLSPGSTPRNKDVVEFFLTERRKGYCAHFASSAVMLLRNMNIPARYVEGYVIDGTDVVDSKPVDDDISNWISIAPNENQDNMVPMEVEITDANAHAWVEVYIDDYGWIPYEFTVASIDTSEINGFTLSNLFSGLLITGQKVEVGGTEDNTNDTGNDNINIGLSFGFITKPLLYVLVFTIILLALISISNPVLIRLKLKYAEAKKDYNKALNIYFLIFTFSLKLKDLSINNYTLRDYEEYLRNRLESAKNTKLNEQSDLDELFIILQKALYSNHQISKEEYKKCSSILKKIRTAK